MSSDPFASTHRMGSGTATPGHDGDDGDIAEHVTGITGLCLRLFATEADVAAEILRTAGSRIRSSPVRDDDVPDIRMYDAAEYARAQRAGTTPTPLSPGAAIRRARARATSPGDAA